MILIELEIYKSGSEIEVDWGDGGREWKEENFKSLISPLLSVCG